MNIELTKHFLIQPNQSAAFVGSGTLEVLSTPSLIALMENTAQELIAPLIIEGHSSVGTEINTQHLKATAIGNEISIIARVTEQSNKIFAFEIEAFENNELIGKATHKRAVINIERFMSRL